MYLVFSYLYITSLFVCQFVYLFNYYLFMLIYLFICLLIYSVNYLLLYLPIYLFVICCLLKIISVTVNFLIIIKQHRRLITITPSPKTNQLSYSDLSC